MRKKYRPDRPMKVEIRDNQIFVTLADDSIISNPLDWHPWLKNATSEQQANVELWVFSVWWPDLDEGLDIEGMKQNIPSVAVERPSETYELSPLINWPVISKSPISNSFAVSRAEVSNNSKTVPVLQPKVKVVMSAKAAIGVKTITSKEWISQ